MPSPFLSRSVFGIACAAILLGAVWLVFFYEKTTPAADNEPQVVRKDDTVFVPENSAYRKRLIVEPVRRIARAAERALPAVLEADPRRSANIPPPVAGRIKTLNVEIGDRVRAGQTLFTIASGDVAQAQADIDRARAAQALAKHTLERTRDLTKIGGGPVKDYQQAISESAQADAELRRAQDRLSALDGDASGDLAVKAPFDGVIATLSATSGVVVSDTTAPVMTLLNTSQVFLAIMASEQDISFVAPGAQAQVEFTAYPGKIWRGAIQSRAPQIEPDTRRLRARVLLDNPDGLLYPNMFAIAKVKAPIENLLVIPSSALLMHNDAITVFVETAPWTFKRRAIETRPDVNGMTPTLSGLSENERVVVSGGILIND